MLIEYGMEHCKTNLRVFRMAVDGKVELIMAVHADDIVIAGSDETCRDFHAALVKNFPTSNLGEPTRYTSCAFKRNWDLGTLKITQKAFLERMLNRLCVNSSSDISVKLGCRTRSKREGRADRRLAVQGDCENLDVAFDHDAAKYLERCACYGALLSQPLRQALEGSNEDNDIPSRDQGLGLTLVRGSGLELTVYSDADYADVLPWGVRRSVGQVTLRGVSRCPQQSQSASP